MGRDIPDIEARRLQPTRVLWVLSVPQRVGSVHGSIETRKRGGHDVDRQIKGSTSVAVF